MMLFFAGPVAAQTTSYGGLQSAYLYNFVKYIRWPEETTVFTIGVWGEAGIMDELVATLKGKKVVGKEIEVRAVNKADALSGCHIIYLPQTASRSLSSLKKAAEGSNTLIVTEDDLVRKGAAISFIVEDDRLRFKLNKTALAEAGLVASEGLLRLAVLFPG